MLGARLFELAEIAGLRQAEVARQLGMQPTNINYWAKGTREIPEACREQLVELIFRAVMAWITEVRQLSRGAWRERFGTEMSRGQVLRRVNALARECIALNRQRRQWESGRSISAVLQHLQKFQGLSEGELNNPEVLQQLGELAHQLSGAVADYPQWLLVRVMEGNHVAGDG